MTPMERIKAERQRQIEVEGWTAEHDDYHTPDQLASAALCYAVHGLQRKPPAEWPWERKWWKPKNLVRNLERAGALYLAASDLAKRQGLKPKAASLRRCVTMVAKDLRRALSGGFQA